MQQDSQRPDQPGWQPRFGLGSTLLMMVVFSTMAAGGYYFLQGVRGGRGAQLGFILFTLAAPLLLMMLASAFQGLASWWSQRRTKR